MIKSKILIGVMALALVGGIGSAFALTRYEAVGTGTSPAFDAAIYLYWDSESDASANLDDIPPLSTNDPVYRILTVAPKSTKSVTGTVTLNFTLAEVGDCVLDGLSVAVYAADNETTEENAKTKIGSADPIFTLTGSSKTGQTSFTVSAASGVHESANYYAIKVNYNGAPLGENSLGGRVTIAQSFAVAA